MEKITGKDNKRIKRVIALRDKAKLRRSEGVFIAEGERMVIETPSLLLKEIYVSEAYIKENKKIPGDASNAVIVTDRIMEQISDTKTPQGILAVVKIPTYERDDILGRDHKPLVFVLEDVRDPGNLGTIFRTCEGAGVTGIVMTRGCVDLFSPKVIRSTMGSVFRMPFVFTDSVSETASFLKENNCTCYAAHLGGKKAYDSFDLTGGTAFFMGNEANGLSDEAAKEADELLLIPMHGRLESLNVAMASGVLGYEAERQRRNA
ncbi:MAG: RNA methyltransferase [Lachnospiraceae bacterium]|nr:RNA methyltransferase [Lachnospiraceae bacterium]